MPRLFYLPLVQPGVLLSLKAATKRSPRFNQGRSAAICSLFYIKRAFARIIPTGQSWMGGLIASAIHSTYRRIRMLSQIQDSTDETLAALRLHQCSQLQRFAQPLPAAHALAVNQLIKRSLLTDVQIRSSLHHYQSLVSFVLVLVYYSISILSSNVAQL